MRSGLPVAAPGPRLTAAHLQPLLDRFVEEKGINCAPDTQRLAGTALTRFAEYWTGPGQGLPYDVQVDCGVSRASCKREQLAVKTQELYLSAVRNFGTWLKASGITPVESGPAGAGAENQGRLPQATLNLDRS
ncbi:MAG: hypothetical protein R3B95_07995 [Nitrospirales bacterium]|nr:hypothetical protein [Nitrospirales bacterium]